MKYCAARKRYSLITLQPTCKEEKKLFWVFRCDDIVDMFDFKVFATILFTMAFLVNYFDDDKQEKMHYRLARRLVNLVFYLIVWIMTRRLKKHYIYFVPVLFIFERFTAMLAAIAATNSTDNGDE